MSGGAKMTTAQVFSKSAYNLHKGRGGVKPAKNSVHVVFTRPHICFCKKVKFTELFTFTCVV